MAEREKLHVVRMPGIMAISVEVNPVAPDYVPADLQVEYQCAVGDGWIVLTSAMIASYELRSS